MTDDQLIRDLKAEYGPYHNPGVYQAIERIQALGAVVNIAREIRETSPTERLCNELDAAIAKLDAAGD